MRFWSSSQHPRRPRQCERVSVLKSDTCSAGCSENSHRGFQPQTRAQQFFFPPLSMNWIRPFFFFVVLVFALAMLNFSFSLPSRASRPGQRILLELSELLLAGKAINIKKSSTPHPFLLASFADYGNETRDVISKLYQETGYFATYQSVIVHHILSRGCRENEVVVDAGAHFGYFTQLAASYGCRVVAIEPQPPLCKLNTLSGILNGVSDRITIHNAALGSRTGEMVVVSAEGPFGTVLSERTARSFTVNSMALRDLVPTDVLLLKIDVEGYEARVLEGLGSYSAANYLVEMKDVGESERSWIKSKIADGFTAWVFDPGYEGAQVDGPWTLDFDFGWIRSYADTNSSRLANGRRSDGGVFEDIWLHR